MILITWCSTYVSSYLFQLLVQFLFQVRTHVNVILIDGESS